MVAFHLPGGVGLAPPPRVVPPWVEAQEEEAILAFGGEGGMYDEDPLPTRFIFAIGEVSDGEPDGQGGELQDGEGGTRKAFPIWKMSKIPREVSPPKWQWKTP